MRIWSLHPAYLDRQGLLACWREGLLAQKVLRGLTKGYRNHPQLLRFKEQADPVRHIAAYLNILAAHAAERGYNFDTARIFQPPTRLPKKIPLTTGQLVYEWEHLRRKLAARSPEWLAELPALADNALPRPHPLFRLRAGPVAAWEIV